MKKTGLLIFLLWFAFFYVFLNGHDLVQKNNEPEELLFSPLHFDTWAKPDIVLNTGVNPGFSDSWDQDMVCQGNYIYVAFEDTRHGTEDIYFNYSSDRGATWLKEDIRLNTGVSPGTDYRDNPKIALSGDNVYVVWADYRTNRRGVYFNYSADRGATWQPSDIRLDRSHRRSSDVDSNPFICASGSRVYVVWGDNRHNVGSWEQDIFFNYSDDYGVTWQKSDTQINTTTGHDQWDPSICCSGEKVYIVWTDERNGENYDDVYFNCSHDGGATWLTSDKRINRDPIGRNDIDDAEIACSGDKVYIVWEDNRSGYRDDIYFNCSFDGGLTWQPSDIRVDTDGPSAGESTDPEICCSGDKVYVAWEDERHGGITDNIFFNYSHDGGLTWGESDQRLGTDTPGAVYQRDLAIACNGSQVHVAWENGNGNDDQTLYNYSLDGGRTWQDSHLRINLGNGDCDDPVICCTSGYVAVVWEEARNHRWNEDVFFRTVNHPPVANGGGNQTVSVLSDVYLDGTNSSDPNGDELEYLWTIRSVPAGSAISLRDTQASIASFTPDQLGLYRVKLEVTDPFGRKNSKIVTIKAIIPPPVNFNGYRETNRSLSQTEYLDILTWGAPGNYTLAGYVIYRVQDGTFTQLAEVGAGTLQYMVRNVAAGTHTYAIRGKDSQGTLSEPVLVTVTN